MPSEDGLKGSQNKSQDKSHSEKSKEELKAISERILKKRGHLTRNEMADYLGCGSRKIDDAIKREKNKQGDKDELFMDFEGDRFIYKKIASNKSSKGFFRE